MKTGRISPSEYAKLSEARKEKYKPLYRQRAVRRKFPNFPDIVYCCDNCSGCRREPKKKYVIHTVTEDYGKPIRYSPKTKEELALEQLQRNFVKSIKSHWLKNK